MYYLCNCTRYTMNIHGNAFGAHGRMTFRFPRGMVILAGSSCGSLAEKVARFVSVYYRNLLAGRA